jgi:sugar O-acyltransferase (sialic acid O-acetyltransferase NeuD family)
LTSDRAIVFYGAGGHAYVLYDMLAPAGFRLDAIFNDIPAPEGFDLKVPVLIGPAIDDWLQGLEPAKLHYAISIGNHYGQARWERHRLLRGRGLNPATLTHRTSHVSPSAKIGEACQVLAFGFVGARAKLGEAVILNSRSAVDHECVLCNGVHIGPGATLSGRVHVGDHTLIGAGAVVLPDLRIGPNVIVGAGAVVTHNLDEPGVYAGAPARRIR